MKEILHLTDGDVEMRVTGHYATGMGNKYYFGQTLDGHDYTMPESVIRGIRTEYVFEDAPAEEACYQNAAFIDHQTKRVHAMADLLFNNDSRVMDRVAYNDGTMNRALELAKMGVNPEAAWHQDAVKMAAELVRI